MTLASEEVPLPLSNRGQTYQNMQNVQNLGGHNWPESWQRGMESVNFKIYMKLGYMGGLTYCRDEKGRK